MLGVDEVDCLSRFLIMILKSLIDSINASIMSKTTLLTTMFPSGSLFVAHLRQAARILSSDVMGGEDDADSTSIGIDSSYSPGCGS